MKILKLSMFNIFADCFFGSLSNKFFKSSYLRGIIRFPVGTTLYICIMRARARNRRSVLVRDARATPSEVVTVQRVSRAGC